eukprot:TRINITY_DN33582_c0_g1_i1.p1 TRINITY_DN33582_c0_g1~~TRINITY_DN33582_c0_g1_i1.p1  ORF type:complete len:849 (+),score=219.58 TRINITY_DN33582_c0_g1_i1:60-2606(+)
MDSDGAVSTDYDVTEDSIGSDTNSITASRPSSSITASSVVDETLNRKKSRGHRRAHAREADQYLSQWKLREALSEAMEAVLLNKPGDPYRFLSERFSDISEGETRKQQQLQSPESLDEIVPDWLLSTEPPQAQVKKLGRKRSAPPEDLASVLSRSSSRCSLLSRSSRTKRLQPTEVPSLPSTDESLSKLVSTALALSSSIVNSADLINVIANELQTLLAADRCAMFIRNENSFLVSPDQDKTIRQGEGLTGKCAEKKALLIGNARSKLYSEQADAGTDSSAILCAPIICDDEVLAVVQLHKAKGKFSETEVLVCTTVLAFAGVSLRTAELYHSQRSLAMKCTFQMDIVSRLGGMDMKSWKEVVGGVSKAACEILSAEQCVLFTSDPASGELVALLESGTEERISELDGIPGKVFQSGEPINLPNARSDPSFDPGLDHKTGIATTSLLAMPVHHRDEVVAVAQVCNKADGCFTKEDEELLQFFSHFAGAALYNSKLYDALVQARTHTLNILDKHSTSNPAPEAQVEKHLVKLDARDVALLSSLEFNVHSYWHTTAEHDKLVGFALSIMQKLQVLTYLQATQRQVVGFLLAVQRRYAKLPCHCFAWAVDALQYLYVILNEMGADKMLECKDVVSVVMSVLLCDIGHMGLNNAYHGRMGSPLGWLGESVGCGSALELHHCQVGIEVLEETGILKGLEREGVAFMVKNIISNIMSSDMAQHQGVLERFKAVVASGYNKENLGHRLTLCNMLMKVVDLRCNTRPFTVARLCARSQKSELEYQGDLERSCGFTPIPAYDRHHKKYTLASYQLAEIDHVGRPLFEAFARSLPSAQPLLTALEANRRSWQAISPGQ